MSEELKGEPGWIPLRAEEVMGDCCSFVSGDPDGSRLQVRYFRREADGALVARVRFGPGAKGPPGHAHGGSMAAVLDEAMGLAAWLAGHSVVAAGIEVDFRRPLPLGSVTTVETEIARVDGRKVRTRGRILGADGSPVAEGRGLFVAIPEGRFGADRPRGFG